MIEIDPNLPIDKIAARVVSKCNDQLKEFHTGHTAYSRVKFPTTHFNGPKEHDLSGKKAGRFIVIGLALWRPNNWKTSANSNRWVSRCSCGGYQMFTTRGIKKNLDNKNFMCIECRKNNQLNSNPLR